MDRRTIGQPDWTFENPLIIYKISSKSAEKYANLVLKYFLKKRAIKKVFVEKKCYDSFFELANEDEEHKLAVFALQNEIDLCIVIGGDGTVLYTNHLFKQNFRPPFITFNLGTLGYMTYYDCEIYKSIFDEILEKKEKAIFFEKRSTIYYKFFPQTPESQKEEILSLNEVVFERETSQLINLEVYINNEPITIVKGDGIIISTSTGSTAYALSVGGTIIHYDVDCLLLNAICPHSLSFRPIAWPRDTVIKVKVAEGSNKATVIIDGIKTIDRVSTQGIEVGLSDKFVYMIVLEKFISLPMKVWKQKLVEQLGWNSAFKNMK